MARSNFIEWALMRRLVGLAAWTAGLVLLAAHGQLLPGAHRAEQAPAAKAAQPREPAARLIRVPLPIVGAVDTQVKRAVQKALAEMPPGGDRPTIVFEFSSPQNQTGQGSDFGRALALARFLCSREMSGTKTVAFVPKPLKGHAVLVAMACEEIIMAPDATIGEAGLDERNDEVVDPTVRSGYREIANRRRTIPPEVALGMLDKDLEVLQVETEVSPEFVLRSELDDLKKKHTIQKEMVLKRSGQLGRLSGREGRELGFVKYLAADRPALAKALSVPLQSLEDDLSLIGDWRPVRLALKGPMSAQLVSRTQRTLEEQIRNGANFICLWIDSPGGSLADSMSLANFLADLDRGKVRSVAYVPVEARGDAALVASACDQLVMTRDAVLGGAGAEEFSSDEIQLARETLRDNLAPKKGRGWSLSTALVDPQTSVYQYTHQPDGLVAYFCESEWQAQADPAAWKRGDEVTRHGEALRLSGDRAHKLGLARHVVADFSQFKQQYGIESDLAAAEPTWADALIDALAAPAVAWLLLLIGGAALYAELQAPGIGVGGFIAGVCFLLYFWSKHLDGTAGWLEVLLFFAGVCCILLEMFVLPGTAIFGLGGGLLIIASLVLASQTFVIPHNDYQLAQLRDSLLGLLGVSVGIVAAAIVMRRYLPHAPFFSHVMLEPPTDAELEDLSHREALVEFDHLLGQQGLATTQLIPSGKARFGDELVDVIADGEVISRGTPIVVIAVQGNRVVVRTVG